MTATVFHPPQTPVTIESVDPSPEPKKIKPVVKESKSILRKPSYALSPTKIPHTAQAHVTVMVPIGLPGMGKTLFWEKSLRPHLIKQHPTSTIKSLVFEQILERFCREKRNTTSHQSTVQASMAPAMDAFMQEMAEIC